MNSRQLKSLLTRQIKQVAPDLVIGIVSGIIGITIAISFATLIFSGVLSGFLAIGIGIALLSAVIARTIVGFTSSFVGIIADVDERSAVILALMAAAIRDRLADTAPPEVILITVVVAIALTTLLTGALLLTLGLLKWGELIRYIPYPVMGGFLAGTGWLLIQAAIQTMTAASYNFFQLPQLFDPPILIHWLPGLLLAISILFLSQRYNLLLVLPGGLLVTTGLFYGVVGLTHTSIADIIAHGWVLGHLSAAHLWQFNSAALSQVQWSAILPQLSHIGTILVITPVAVLLTASGLELVTDQELDLDQELRAAGIANLISGSSGGLVGCHILPDSVMAYQMGASSRMASLFSAVPCALVLLVQPPFLSLLPKVVTGGLLLFLGLSLLVEWVYDAWFKLTRSDYLIVLLILLAIVTTGLLQGILLGLIIAVILFVINYSRISVVRRISSGTHRQSNVVRPMHQSQLLRDQGSQIQILELQGFLFFGTANRLVKLVSQRLQNPELPLRFIVLDFHRVSGVDSSAILSFRKIKQKCCQHQVQVILTHLAASQHQLLQKSHCLDPDDWTFSVLSDIDRGLEYCEEHLLETTWRRQRFLPLVLQLKRLFPDNRQVSTFMPYLEQLQIPIAEILYHQGSQPDCIYFVESGQVSTFIELEDGQTIRLQTLRAGTLLGEIAFHTQSPYPTSAITDQPSTIYRLSRASFQKMQQEQPHTSAGFQALIIHLLADRLVQAHNEIENLLS